MNRRSRKIALNLATALAITATATVLLLPAGEASSLSAPSTPIVTN